MDYPGRVQICEVGPRDGLQNEQGEFSTADKVALVGALADTGIPTIEVTSMVSPRAVPQMADGEQVLALHRAGAPGPPAVAGDYSGGGGLRLPVRRRRAGERGDAHHRRLRRHGH